MCRHSARSSEQVGRDSIQLRALGMIGRQEWETKHTKSMSGALCRSGQHCNKCSIVIELNEKSSLRLCRAS